MVIWLKRHHSILKTMATRPCEPLKYISPQTQLMYFRYLRTVLSHLLCSPFMDPKAEIQPSVTASMTATGHHLFWNMDQLHSIALRADTQLAKHTFYWARFRDPTPCPCEDFTCCRMLFFGNLLKKNTLNFFFLQVKFSPSHFSVQQKYLRSILSTCSWIPWMAQWANMHFKSPFSVRLDSAKFYFTPLALFSGFPFQFDLPNSDTQRCN